MIAETSQVFVGNLPYSVTWQELKMRFEQAGSVVRADVLQQKGRSKGFGRVAFESPLEANNAIEMFNESDWDGRTISVRKDQKPDAASGKFYGFMLGKQKERSPFVDSTPVDTRALYVGNLPFSVSWQALKDLFKQAGVVERADIPLDHQKRSKGFGLVLMEDIEQARLAQEMFHNYDWQGRTLDVRADKNFIEKRTPEPTAAAIEKLAPKAIKEKVFKEKIPEPSAQQALNSEDDGTSLFVGNLPYNVDSDEVADIFQGLGVEKVTVASDAYGKSRGYAQVIMSSAEAAVEAIEKLNGAEVGGRQIQVRYDTKRGAVSTPLVPGSQLPFNMRWQDLKDLFRTGFTPLHASVALDSETGRSRGYGIVRFASQKEAEGAVAEMNGATVSGRVVSVRLDKYTSEDVEPECSDD